MQIAATADLHGVLPKEMPETDLTIIAGDISPLRGPHYPKEQLEWFDNLFMPWLISTVKGPKILIAGNHDFFLETPEGKQAVARWMDEDKCFIYLENQSIDVGGLKIYGTPYTPNLPRWAFQVYDGAKHMVPKTPLWCPTPKWAKELFSEIPKDLDVLVSHGPPAGYGDTVGVTHVGCMALLEAVVKVRPRLMICGHIHEGYGHYKIGDITDVYCVSHMTRSYEPINPIVEIDIHG